MSYNFLQTVTGGASIGAVEAVQTLDFPTTSESGDILKLVLQIVIAIATFFQFRQNKKQTKI